MSARTVFRHEEQRDDANHVASVFGTSLVGERQRSQVAVLLFSLSFIAPVAWLLYGAWYAGARRSNARFNSFRSTSASPSCDQRRT